MSWKKLVTTLMGEAGVSVIVLDLRKKFEIKSECES